VGADVELGGSEYLAIIHGVVAGKPPKVDFDLERRVQKVCRDGIRAGWIRSAHDCAEGGLAVALAESCIAGNLGARINLGVAANLAQRLDVTLFGEGGARILVSVQPEIQETWENYLTENLGDKWQKLGYVADYASELGIFTTDNSELIKVRIKEISDRYSLAIPRRLKAYS
jgi:phosphoribosylformylglycinamidine synthase